MPGTTLTPPDLRLDTMIRDLRSLRAKGLDRSGEIHVPALASCVSILTGVSASRIQPHHYEVALGAAIKAMGDGDATDSAAILFGLAPHVRGLHPIELRKRAAEFAYDRESDATTVDAFRKTREPRVLTVLATALIKTATNRSDPEATTSEPYETLPTTRIVVSDNGSGWRPRELPLLRVDGAIPGRIRELSWVEFGAGIEQVRAQIRDYGTNLDIDLAVGVNEGGLLMATLLASATFARCGIAYVRTVRHGSQAVIDERHVALGAQVASAGAVMLCDYEVKTAPILSMVIRYLRNQGLDPQAPVFLATMGLLATTDAELSQADDGGSLAELACGPTLKAAGVADVFGGYLMASPGIDPPLGLR